MFVTVKTTPTHVYMFLIYCVVLCITAVVETYLQVNIMLYLS